jgi:putative PIN family toxin of toxin-antitoxin system
MIKVVVDTNILVSASFWKGNPYIIIQMAVKKEIEIFTSAAILKELAKALKRDFKIPEPELNERMSLFLGILTIIEPKIMIQAVKEDPEDNKILEAAIQANAGFVVSGDKHLLKLKEFKGIQIFTAKKFLEKMKEK